MTENENRYISIRDLSIIRSAIKVLSQIMPASSLIVHEFSYKDVMERLHHWEEELSKIVKTFK